MLNVPHKSRKTKESEYLSKFGMIPKDYKERLEWLYDNLHITEAKGNQIIAQYEEMRRALYYTQIQITLYEIPEGSPRPRFRLVNRKNLGNMAMANPEFVHVYSITGAEDNKFMKRLVSAEDFNALEHIIYTPCDLVYTTFLKTPSYFNAVDTYLAELGVHRPTTKPDWDNIGKKYSDMSNANLWLDDNLVVSGTVHKYYSVLPRVEIQLWYLNMLTNKWQFETISKKYDGEIRYYGDGL